MLRLAEIAFVPLVTFALLWVARTSSVRLGRRLPVNALTRFLYRAHKMRPPYTAAERRDWQAWFWPLFVFVALIAVIWYGFPDLH